MQTLTSASAPEEPWVAEQPVAPKPAGQPQKNPRAGIYNLLIGLILLMGFYFRFQGIYWGEFDQTSNLHPDERFLVWVGTDIAPVASIREYFDTQNSTLNPQNRGHGFFVYGTLPMFLTRYIVQWVYGHSGFAEMTWVGRPLSALADLATVLLIYLIASRLFNRKVGLLAAAFLAAAVLPIQLSHYFAMDTFANFFIWLVLYFAVLIAQSPSWQTNQPANQPTNNSPISRLQSLLLLPRHPAFGPCLLFGVFSGMALASKLSAYPIVFMLPLAAGVFLLHLPPRERPQQGVGVLFLMAFAGILCLLTFRLLQPFAFTGPGFFDLTPNPEWLQSLKSLQDLLRPSIGYPPAVQWIDRPIWFSGYNLTAWGLGWPLGLAAWAGLLWMGWRLFKRREWRAHGLIWIWTAGHFVWVSTFFNPTMRYQLPIYPGLALMAAWFFVEALPNAGLPKLPRFNTRALMLALGAFVLLATLAYALAFSGIYSRQITRLAASRWMYANLPGPINLPIQTGTGELQQPLPFPPGLAIRPELPFFTQFTPHAAGTLSEIRLAHVVYEQPALEQAGLYLQILSALEDPLPLTTATLATDFPPPTANQTGASFRLEQPALLEEQRAYVLKIDLLGGARSLDVCGELVLIIQTSNGQLSQALAPPDDCTISTENPYILTFTPAATGEIHRIDAARIVDPQAEPPSITLRAELSSRPDMSQTLAASSLTLTPGRHTALLEEQLPTFIFDAAVPLLTDQTYYLQISLESGVGQVALQGTAIAVESSWDDPLPMRVDGYDAYGGIYQGHLNFEMYWFDDEAKRQRFYDILDAADVIAISSSRQWGSVGRLEAVYPISSGYYRYLLGCPPDRTVEWCYNVAEPGMFEGQLGFELVRTFTSHPRLGPFEINDQPSEEAFTVYDHPKVFIFAKTADYDPARVRALLGALPLGRPLEEVQADAGGARPAEVKSLMLPPERLSIQQRGGTWAELFDADGVLNRFQPLAVIVWYGAATLIGLVSYPLVRLALPGLDDRGYPLARVAGMLILSYLVWLAGSFGIPVTRWTITGGVLLVGALGLGLAALQRGELRRELAEKRRYFLTVEGLALAFFLLLLLIRLGNPDLWHPWKGGEKPMDFAYLNAVLKSTTFPPYDPWFAGGYINYYYYGFVFVGVLVKWLGIVPSVAYNLILPTLFSMLAMGAFSVGWNLVQSRSAKGEERAGRSYLPYWIGLAAAVGIAVFGNLGMPRMIIRGYQMLAAPPGAVLEETFFLTRWVWTLQGLLEVLRGGSLPYALGDWYWIPSRAIPAPGDVEPITEFPFFTFLYADLHAHMIALPITLLALAWVVSVGLARGFVVTHESASEARWRAPLQTIAGFFLGGLAIGALRTTNTWDFPTYLALGMVGLGYGLWAGSRAEGVWQRVPAGMGQALRVVLGVGALAALAMLLFQPYTQWYALGYTEANVWQGTHTPLSAYLVHWGLFLFLMVSWMAWETLDWLASVPISALAKLRRMGGWLLGAAAILFTTIATLWFYYQAPIAWFVVSLAAWAGVLLLRPGLPDAKRLVLFLIGTGLVLTQAVEVVVLFGDIGRMNTVFKFYLQVWVLFGVSAAASLGWLLREARPRLHAVFEGWARPLQRVWQAGLLVLVIGAAMYPLLGGVAKIKDRMAEDAPRSLDGNAYMLYARYHDAGVEMSLDEDYRAIRWLQENVQGSPVIVEGHTVEYRWGARVSINTGLPAVLGWNWHQRQQRIGHDAEVWNRANEVGVFYNTPLMEVAQEFLDRYGVRYIIVGQLERAYYEPLGLEKFEAWDGLLWRAVYRDGQTVIYEVVR